MVDRETGPQADPLEETTLSPELGEAAGNSKLTARQQLHRLGVATAATFALVASVWLTQKTSNKLPSSEKTERLAPSFEPNIIIKNSATNNEQAARQADMGLANSGHAIDIRTSGRNSHGFFNYLFRNEPFYESKPRLREIIDIQDRHIFKRENAAYPRLYPFDIFNTSDRPINILFAYYALRANRYWLNKNSGPHDTLDIGGHTFAKVRPRIVPHEFIMTDAMPVFIKHGDAARGVTYKRPNYTETFITPSHKFGLVWFRHQTIATEECQSLVELYDARAVPGKEKQQAAMVKEVGQFNPDAADNLDLAAKEVTCNGLGRIITSAWEGEWPAIVRRMLSKDFKDPVKFDYSLYGDQVPRFIWLARHVPAEPNVIITVKNSDAPTAIALADS